MVPPKPASSKKLASPRRVVISEEEYVTDTTSSENVQTGVEEFQTHGFVILENAIDSGVVQKLGSQMREDAAICLTFPDLNFNHGNEQNNFSVTPPLSNDYMFESFWANRHAIAIMQQIIGPRPLLCWASSNVAVQSGPGARQAVHSDTYADIPNFPFCVELNIYLQDTTPENGSTELWPGTHVFTEDDHLLTGRGFIKKKAFTDRARTCPPIQPIIPAGSILMRDLRLWHAGMPNATATPRVIAALLYFPQWFEPLMRLTLPESVRPKAEAWSHIDLLSNTDFVEGPVDHLRMRFPINFTQDPAKAMVQYRRTKDGEQGRALGAVIPVTKDNYWTPSKYQTRAAVNKRKREAEDKGEEEQKRRQKREQMKSEAEDVSKNESEAPKLPEIKKKVGTEQEAALAEQKKAITEREEAPKLSESTQEVETGQDPAVAEQEDVPKIPEVEQKVAPELPESKQEVEIEKESAVTKQKEVPKPEESKKEVGAGEGPVVADQEEKVQPGTELSPGLEAEKEPEPKVIRRPWLTSEEEISHEKPKLAGNFIDAEDELTDDELISDTSSGDGDSDQSDSPGYPPEWMEKLNEDQETAREEEWKSNSGDYEVPEYSEHFTKDQPKADDAKPKSDTEQLDDLPDYEDSPVHGSFPDLQQERAAKQARRREKVAARERAISVAQRKTFKPDYVPGSEFGPGISPQFSPKSQPESPRKPNMTQGGGLEKEIHEKQVRENLSKQQTIPVAKIAGSPQQRQTSPPYALTEAQASWERDPRPYKGPRPGTPKHPDSASPFQSPPPLTPPHPSHSRIPHVSPYCAAAPPSPIPLEYSPTRPGLLLRPPPPQPPSSPPPSSSSLPLPSPPRLPSSPPPSSSSQPSLQPSLQHKATDAYDAFIQAQLLQMQTQQLRIAELRRARDERNGEGRNSEGGRQMNGERSGEGREIKGDGNGNGEGEGGETEWLSVEEAQESEWGW